MSVFSRVIAIAILALAATAPIHAVTSDGELVFGIIATESAESLHKSWDGFIDIMERGVGMKVKPFFAPDYAGVIEGMKYGKVDVAWYGNKSAMEAVDHANAEIFAQMTDAKGAPGYWSHLIVHQDSPYNSIEDLIENGDKLVFGNGDPNSTSGFLVPSYYVWALRGIDPGRHFKHMTHANHEANILAVANKKVDFSTCNNKAIKRVSKNHPGAADQVKVIWQSPLIPSDPFAWGKDLDHEIKMKVKAWFLSAGRIGDHAAEELKVLNSTSGGLGCFRDSSNHQLLPIRQLALYKNKVTIMKDEKYSDDDKKTKIAAIDAQLADLEKMTEMLANGL